MRRATIDLEEVKRNIKNLQGQNIEMSIDRGRKKIEYVSATIQDIYPSVFTVAIKNQSLQTFSYFDVLCKKVVLLKNISNK